MNLENVLESKGRQGVLEYPAGELTQRNATQE